LPLVKAVLWLDLKEIEYLEESRVHSKIHLSDFSQFSAIVILDFFKNLWRENIFCGNLNFPPKNRNTKGACN
jgi:hypothetical protein